MVQTVGAANNGASNSSSLPTNTAKSPVTATKNSGVLSKVVGKDAVSKSRRALYKAGDALSVEGGTSEELEKLSNVVMSGPTPLTDPWAHAMKKDNPDGLGPADLKRTLLPFLDDAKADKCGGIYLVGNHGQVTLERSSVRYGFMALKSKVVYKLGTHELNNNNEFGKEVHAELSDELVLSMLRCLGGERAVNNLLSPGSVSDADLDVPDETDDDVDLKVHDLTNVDIDADVQFACHHLIDNSDPAENLLRRNSIYESFDENVFRENAGLTEDRNRADSISSSVSSEGSDIYTRQPNETGNAHNESVQTDASSNSLESSIPTVKIPRAKLTVQTPIKQRMLAANENNLRVVGPDGLPATIWDFGNPEGQEKISKYIQDFAQSQSADFEKIDRAKLMLEEFQQTNPNSVSEHCMEFVSESLLNRSNLSNLYQQSLDFEKKNLAQAIRKQNEISSSGAEIDGDAALLQADSIEKTAWLTRVQIAEHIEELIPVNTVIERVERLLGQRETSSLSVVKPTAGSTVKSSSSVVDINAFRPDDSMHTFTFEISPDAVVTTVGTLNGSESKTTPPRGSPSDLRAGTDFGGVRHIAGKMESVIEKNKRKAVKNTPPKGTAGIQS